MVKGGVELPAYHCAVFQPHWSRSATTWPGSFQVPVVTVVVHTSTCIMLNVQYYLDIRIHMPLLFYIYTY